MVADLELIAFYGGRPDMESITLVPYERVYPGDEPGEVTRFLALWTNCPY